MNPPTLPARQLCVGLLGIATGMAFAQTTVTQISVRVDKPGIKISPTFYGLMTEEINHSYDGGLYAELIQNRSFRDDKKSIPHWTVASKGTGEGAISLDQDGVKSGPLGVALKLTVGSASAGNTVGIANDGFWGIPVKPHIKYKASFYVKADKKLTLPLLVSVKSSDGDQVFASTKVTSVGQEWKRVDVTLRTGNKSPSASNQFVISTQEPATLWFKDVSLFAPTYHNRTNGNRPDLMAKLGDMKPSFLRLPGGNYLEGNHIAERFEWKDTIGPVTSRVGHQCPWGYRSSDGLGLLEYLEWCEDLKMQPVLAVYAGYSLEQEHIAPGPQLEPFVQDALDEIEYVTGSTKTKWGAVRAKNGHPKPFPLTYVEIGNEDEFDRSRSYDGRYTQFADAIKAKYPKLQLIATARVTSRTPDVIDDHYYRSARDMARDSGHYDRYDRKGPKIFVGEWASIGGNPTPTFNEAIGDAAWLTGLERNSDLVVMEAYAPLLVNVNPGASQWPTNLIGYDALSSFGSPSYYVQSMFGNYTGDTVLPAKIKLRKQREVKAPIPHGAIGLGTWITDSEYKDPEVLVNGKVVYKKDFSEGLSDWKLDEGNWNLDGNALEQTTLGEDTHAESGDRTWTDYTYHVKARKLSGVEGFLILFHVQNRRDYLQWNIGGWGNTRSALQRHLDGSADEFGEPSNVTVETNRWYDIKIELHGTQIKCYLDDKLITVAEDKPVPVPDPLYVAASVAKASGDIFVKVVNTADWAISSQVNLEGVDDLSTSASGWVLTGDRASANTIAEPKKVAPKPISLKVKDSKIAYTFPPFSVTVVKIPGKG